MSLNFIRLSFLAACLVKSLSVPVMAEQAASAVAAPTTTAVPETEKTPAAKASTTKKNKKTAKPAPPPPAEEEPLGVVMDLTDPPREYISEKFVGFVNEVDRFFGDDRNFQESNDSVLQIDIDRLYGYGSKDKVEISGRAKISLPNTERKLHLLIESDPDDTSNTDSKRRTATKNTTKPPPKSIGAGVRYDKAKDERWNYGSDLGLQFQGLKTRPFVRGRVSYTQPVDIWTLKVSETLFWFYTTGPGETNQIDMDRKISDTTHFRSSSIATWYHNPQNMDMQQSFTWFHTLDDRTAVLYQIGAFAKSQPARQITDTVLLLVYRYRLHRDWMYFEVSPQLHFPKDKSYHASPALLLRLEMLFEKSAN